MTIDRQKTQATQRRYDRIAPLYDLMETIPEQLYEDWRERVWEQIEGPQVLEVGVGTGKNLPYHPDDVHVTGIDLSPKMLARARQKAEELDADIDLRQMDAQNMTFDADTFDSAVSTCVFCSVPDAKLGLEEIRRVLKPGGRLVMLEHTRSKVEALGKVMDLLDPLTVRLMGPHINRQTVETVRRAEFEVEDVKELDGLGIFNLIVARVPRQ